MADPALYSACITDSENEHPGTVSVSELMLAILGQLSFRPLSFLWNKGVSLPYLGLCRDRANTCASLQFAWGSSDLFLLA